MKLNRICAVCISALMSMSVLASCGSSDNSSESSKASNTKSDTNNSTSQHITSPAEMRDISSMDLVKEMKLCWNLGNSLDVCNADRDGDGVVNESSENVDETLWGNVKTTAEIFQTLKDEGFNAVRIPITWRDHVDDEYNIDEDWLNRVEEVVDYAYDLDMYVIINVHHDGGGDPDFGAWIRTTAVDDYSAWEAKYTSMWNQIGERFENYSDKLIFESMNEVGFDDLGTNAAYELLNKMNQTFVDTIRKQGGNNASRHLLIAGYWTDIDKTTSALFQLPTDAANRCIVSVHYYTPWEFCTCENQYSWGEDSEVTTMETQINKLKTTFIDNNIPVIIGEYGTGNGNEPASRVYFSELLTKTCYDIGIPCFLWDDGSGGCFDRTTLKWNTEGMLEALQKAVSGEDYTVTKAS